MVLKERYHGDLKELRGAFEVLMRYHTIIVGHDSKELRAAFEDLLRKLFEVDDPEELRGAFRVLMCNLFVSGKGSGS